MSYTFLKSFLLPAALVTGIASCSKKLDSAYENPNALKRQPVETLFPGLIGNFVGNYSSAGTGYGVGGDGLLIGRYIQYWNNYTLTSTDNGGTQYDQMGGTIGSSDNLGSVWAAFYYGMGQNLNRTIDWAVEDKKWDYAGGAQALRAWGWLELANEYADAVIIKQAFDINRQQFDYDSQALAYDSCRAACYKALAFLNTTGGNASQGNFAIGDAYFLGGDVNKWKKFTYGILARSFAYLSNKSTYQPDSVIKYCDLSITSNADNATCKFAATGISGTSNYFGPFRNNVASYRQSAYIANLMSGRNTSAFNGVTDPRLWYMLRENPDSTFYGVQPAQEGTSTLASANLRPQNFWGGAFTSTATASNGRYIFRDSSQFPMMTASEILFLKAEAAYRKGDKTTALAAYTSAISQNFDMLANTYGTLIPANRVINAAVRDAYLANPAIVPATAANLTLTHIMLQKYIALYGWGMLETWTDMRRYHYKDLDAATGKQVYADFVPANGSLYPNNGGKFVYRARPRYNSEYIYDIPSLAKMGATDLTGNQVVDYHTKESWYSQP